MTDYLWYLSAAAQLTALLSLVRSRLVRTYPAWFLSLSAGVSLNVVLIAISRHNPLYRVIWGPYALLACGLMCGAAGEVIAKLRTRCPNIGPLHLREKCLVAVTLALATLGARDGIAAWSLGDPVNATLCLAMMANRYVSTAAALILFIFWWHFRDAGRMVCANLRAHIMLLTSYCGVIAILYWVPGPYRPLANAGLGLFPAMLYLAWAYLLTEDGQARVTLYPAAEATERLPRAHDYFRALRMRFWEIRHHGRD